MSPLTETERSSSIDGPLLEGRSGLRRTTTDMRPSLRILIFNWLDPIAPRAGGAEHHLEEVFGPLVARGHEVTLVTSGWDGARAEDVHRGIRIVRAGRPWNFSFAWRAGLARAGGFDAYDIVVEDLNKLPIAAGSATKLPSVLMVHHLWGREAFRAAALPVALTTWLTELGLARSYAGHPVIAVSESGREELVRRGFERERIRVIENGVVIPPSPPAGEKDRASLPTFTYVGRLQPYKRVHLLLDAVATLRAEGTECRAVIAGTGPSELALKRRASRLGLSDVVAFTGYVSDAERERIFREAWTHVQPSSREGWGLTVMEAAAAGTSTVAANSAGLCDSVVHGVTGLLVPKRFLPTFADALRFIARNPEEAWQLGRAAHARAAKYTWDRAAMGVEEVLLQRWREANGATS